MKKATFILAAVIGVSTMSFVPKSTDFKVDTKETKVTWRGSKVVGEHTGNISLKEGKVITTGNAFSGGTFVMDMTSITNTDLTDATYRDKLVGHLKSDDFFSSDKHKTSMLVVKSVTKTSGNEYKVKGDLTIKGITQPVEFPATVVVADNKVTGKAKIVIDRTKYDIKYGSGSFFDNLGDKAINNEFELNIDLVAKK